MKDSSFSALQPLAASELVLDGNGAVYHLGLLPHQMAPTIIVVGDQNRVQAVSKYFDKIDFKVSHREFYTHTGTYKGLPITALSTGIGVDNIDIVLNELDALVNIDLKTKRINPDKKRLNIIRIGTSGALNPDIPVGSFVHSAYAIGLDGMLHYYNLNFEADEMELIEKFIAHCDWQNKKLIPYAVRGSGFMDQKFSDFSQKGITITANGFYGPQGRKLRLNTNQDLNDVMGSFSYRGLQVANYEMESSALFGLGAALGHQCTTVCAVIANRMRKEFLKDTQPAIDQLILKVLNSLARD